MHGAGFEPAKLYAMALKTIPFDHSGIHASKANRYIYLQYIHIYYF